MDVRTCSKCKTDKPTTEFYKKNQGLQSWCKTCTKKKQALRWRQRKLKAIELFGGQCQRCGYDKNFAALHFHHKSDDKNGQPHMALRWKWERTIEELKKCILVCANCHAELHNPQDVLHPSEPTNQAVMNLGGLQATDQCKNCGTDVYGTECCSDACAKFIRRKVTRPSASELEALIATMPLEAIGRKYGVSGVAVKKWVKFYGIEWVPYRKGLPR